ncbi:F-box/kelch-repeat protein At1g57790-like [Bidens hawaiensis]|uniref:F-box/kelch-repeat protein At1g57790-like n=1 Tax=Bidens hawaiensis TaxID=980011 RepID=UPI00404AF891
MALGSYFTFVIEVDIVVKEKEVVISLLPFVEVPRTSYNRCPPVVNSFRKFHFFLKGSCTDLFYIGVAFNEGNRIGYVYLFKLDITSMMWEDMLDLKEATFFLELASDYSACYYGSTGDSQLEGYVHILGDSGEVVYSFHAQDGTMSVSSMPCLVRESEASSWAMLELRLKVDHVELKLEKEDKDTHIVARPIKSDNIDFDNTRSESHLLNIPIHILETIMELCIDPVRGDMYFMKTPQELKDNYQIYCSRYGWLLIYRIEDEPQLAFFNPFTSNIHKLPEIPYLESFCFSAPPTSPDCMVVGFTMRGHWHVFIHFVSQDSTWRRFLLNFGDDDPYSYHFLTFYGQDVYALCNYKGVHVFRDMSEVGRSLDVVVDEVPRSRCRSPAQYFLLVCDEHLLLVTVGKFGESVEVFNLKSTLEWEKLDGLGKHTIYISNTSCICLEAKTQEMENKIFFPRLLHNEDTKIVFYSLETYRYHTFDEKNIEENFGVDLFQTKHPCYPHTWIEPSWS